MFCTETADTSVQYNHHETVEVMAKRTNTLYIDENEMTVCKDEKRLTRPILRHSNGFLGYLYYVLLFIWEDIIKLPYYLAQ